MKKRLVFLLICIMAFSLSGCWMRTIDQMYKHPMRSSEYSNLQAVIDSAMVGMEYASPMSGENQQTVQMADLTGDGRDECLVFAKKSSDKMLYILIFSKDEADNYCMIDQIECNGSAFEQVEYVDVDGRAGNDIVIGRRLNTQIMAIASVYSLSSGQSEQIMSTVYSKFLTLDIDNNGLFDLFVIRDGEGQKENAFAMVYSYIEDSVVRSVEADLSESVAHIRRIAVSKLSSGEPAVFISSSFSENSIVTDIFAIKNKSFINLTFSSESQMSVQTLRNYFLYSEDIDGDGVLEIPSLVEMRAISDEIQTEQQHLIRWYCMDLEGKQDTKVYSFHNYTDGWFFKLDNSYADRVTVEQHGRDYTFYFWDENYTEAVSAFTIYTLTGKDRDTQADAMNHFALYRGENVVYSGGLAVSAGSLDIDETFVADNFHLISQSWKDGNT